jgi:nucleotide-binding universal stress UspA family protein
MTHEIIVVGVAHPELTDALRGALRDRFAPDTKGELCLVHVVAEQALGSTIVDALPALGPSERALTKEAETALEAVCAEIEKVLPVKARFSVVSGDAADEILAVAQRVNATLILVEGHHHGPLARVFHRSVAAKLAETAPCSLLVVRSHAAS